MVLTRNYIAKNIKTEYNVFSTPDEEVICLNPAYVTAFDARQEMLRADFEIFHHYDADSCNVAPHSHGFYEIYCLLADQIEYMVEGKRYALRPGSLLLIAPGEVHRPEISDSTRRFERIVLWMNPDFIRSLTGLLPRVKPTLLNGLKGRNLILPDAETYALIKGLLFSLLHEKSLADMDSEYLSRLVVTQLLVHLCRYLARSPETAPFKAEQRYAEIMRVYEYIGAHLRDDLSVSGLAELFFMDKNTLTRQFKRLIGLTPGECIRRGRLEAAHTMIGRGASMQEACAECGFSDYSAFYRAFRQAYGMSPSAFASAHRADSAKNGADRSKP